MFEQPSVEERMRFERLDLNLLVALHALLEDRSVSVSARRLCVSQPAASACLNRLRAFFEDDLLVQSGRRMLLTPKAESLRDPVRDALNFIRAKITTPVTFDPNTTERHFTIVASDYAYHVLVADVLRAASRAAPGISFEMVPVDRNASKRLDRGEVDLFLTLSTHMDDSHPRLPLFEDDHAVIAWTDGIYGSRLSEEGFFAAGHAVAYFGPERNPSFTETCFAQQGMDRKIEVRLPNFAGLPDAVLGTDRLATMYRRHAEHFARFLPVTVHPSPVPLPNVVEAVQWHTIKDSDLGVKWLVALLASRASLMPSMSVSKGTLEAV